MNQLKGVEEVAVDRKTNMVVVKGKTAEPLKLCHRIRHKTGRNAQLLSPLPPKPAEEEKPKEDDNNKDIKDEPPQKDQVCICFYPINHDILVIFLLYTLTLIFSFYSGYLFGFNRRKWMSLTQRIFLIRLLVFTCIRISHFSANWNLHNTEY